MKKTKKILAVVLSVLVAFASMPVVYTSTAASGTADNPTLPVSQSGAYTQNETNNLAFSQKSLKFVFYQTMDDEYFKLNQTVLTDKYCGAENIANTVNVNLSFQLSTTDAATTSFFNNNSATLNWVAADSASASTAFPASFPMEGSYWGTTDYSWTSTVTFKGHSASQEGLQNYSYTQDLNYAVNITNSDGVIQSENTYNIPITTQITVIDAREFKKELAQAENVVANPGNYSQAQVSATQAMLNDIPADLKNLSAVYGQSIVNSFTEQLASINENAADYTAFNSAYAEAKAFNNNEGIYSAQSYNAYVAEVQSINAGLSKTLDNSQQATVDAATQAIINAKELLVIEFDGTGSTTQSDIEDVTPVVGNEFNFIQIEDDQVLAFVQPWTIHRGSKSSNRMFYITLDTTDANTAAFAPKFTAECVETVPSLISGGFEGTLTNQTIFTNWSEVDENGNLKTDVDAIKDGCIDPEYGGFKSEVKYYFNNNLSFKGLSAGETGPKTYTYVQKFYVNWTSWSFGTVNHFNSTTYSTTLNITDARALVKEYNEAKEVLANPGLHSQGYVTELQKIVDSVPQDMVNGTKYYTQAEVDAYYNEFVVLSESLADYSALDAAYERIETILANPDAYSGATIEAAKNAKAQADAFDKGLLDSFSNRQLIAEMVATLNSVADNAEAKADYSIYETYSGICHSIDPKQYTGDAYTEFMEVVNSVESTLPLDLGTSQQATVDEACNTLLNAYLKLTGGSITEPDSTGAPFTQDAITGEYTNGVIKFTVNYPEYNFTQTLNDEKLSMKTTLTISSADSSKVVTLKSLKISSLDQNELASLDTSGNCYNSDSVTINNAENIFIVPNKTYEIIQGVDLLLDDNGNQYADTNGDMAWFNTWQNTAGVALSEGGLIKETTLTTEDSSATAEFIFASAGGGDTTSKLRSYTYVLRLAWTEDGVEHHAHIPVTYNISDARYLHETYYAYMDFINAGNNGTYTDASFQAAADIMASVNTDIVNGQGYYTQEQIDAETAKLGNALGALTTKADYSAFEEAKAAVDALVNAPAGTYTDATITAANNVLAEIATLNKDLDSSNQATVDEATAKLQAVLDAVQEKADYSDFDAAKDALEEIVNAPEGTYTDETVENAKDALEEANKVNPDLPKDDAGVNQDIIDDATQNMQDVINSAEKRADYTDYNNAKSEADNLVNDDGNGNAIYDETVFDAYKEAVNNIDTNLNKDLSADEQGTVDNATQALEDLKADLESNKKADYTEFDQLKDILEQIVNAPEGTYTDESVQKAQEALDNANNVPSDMVVGENNANQDIIDAATQNMKDVIDSVEKKADYTDYNNAKSEADNLVNDDGNGNPIYDETIFDAYKEAINNIDTNLNKDLSADEQGTVDNATQALEDLKADLENNKKADYTDFDAAKDALEEIVNAPEGTYTDETVKNAQDALDNANNVPSDMVVGENNANQDIIDNATQNMQDVIDSAEKKADYTEFDKAVEDLENIVNAPEGTYTDETVKNAQDALDSIVDVDTDLPESEQGTLDEITNGLKDVIDSAKEKADYTDYNNAKAEADSLVNDDGNGNPIYDETAFNEYKEAVNNIDTNLNKDLSADEQGTVDNATQAIEDLKAVLEEKKIYTVTFIGLGGETLSVVEYVNGSTFGTITAPALPENTDTTVYVGWLNDATFMVADSVLTGDVTLTIAEELSKLVAKAESTVAFNAQTGYATGINKNTTVSQFKAQLENDETVVEIKNYTGDMLSDESLVGTGSTITLKSKYTDVVYDTKTIIIYGDIDGDGDVDKDDYSKSKLVGLDELKFADNEQFFFVAADLGKDGYIDAIDCSIIALIMKNKREVLSVE